MSTSSSARIRRRLLIPATVMMIATISGLVLYFSFRPQSAVPPAIMAKLNFKPFVTDNSGALAIDGSTILYQPAQGGLSYIAKSPELGGFTVSEQATPQEFIDIPDYYSQLVDHMNRYSVFDDQLGTVYLTNPGDQSGQTAVLNASGVLMFVRSSKNLSDSQWRQVFDTFMLQS